LLVLTARLRLLGRLGLACSAGLAVLAIAGCGWFGSSARKDDPAATLAAVNQAHTAYVAAINSNNVEQWMTTLGDDVVYLVPYQRAIVGKDAVAAWARKYLQEVTTRWTKAVEDMQVSGDWAVGRYVYTASDSTIIRDPETDGGGTANDSGWGLVVYHRERDGSWRVARDAWGSDRPAR
jgi:ketosteroid isomerase-like protein